MVKMTFTLDDDTVQRLREIAARLDRPQSYVVREAIREYGARESAPGKLSETERLRMLYIIDHLLPRVPKRPQEEVDAEIREIREARRHGGRQHPVRER